MCIVLFVILLLGMVKEGSGVLSCQCLLSGRLGAEQVCSEQGRVLPGPGYQMVHMAVCPGCQKASAMVFLHGDNIVITVFSVLLQCCPSIEHDVVHDVILYRDNFGDLAQK